MKVSLNNLLLFSFLTIPISFKIQFLDSVYLYPQEIIIAVIVVFKLIVSPRQIFIIPRFLQPFIYYLIAVILLIISTVISYYNFIDISGLFKSFKYLLYIIAILIISKNNFNGFIKVFNRIAVLSILFTLIIYLWRLYSFTGSLSEYMMLTTWDVNYVPSGFSNLNLNLAEFSFSRSSGNHGIYGSYLILVYILNLYMVLESKTRNIKFSVLLILLAVFNLFLLTSRESLLVFIIVNFSYFFKDLLKFRVKKFQLYIILFLLIFIIIAVANGINFGLINKIQHTLDSLTESGTEQNINLRFNVWLLILYSLFLFPFHIVIGYGYNQENFLYYLERTNGFFNLYENYATVPESLFFMMLAYGGIFALVFILLFSLDITLKTYLLRTRSPLHELFFYFVVAVIITNNTGGSLMSDLFLAQFALFYIFIHKYNVQNKSTALNCSS